MTILCFFSESSLNEYDFQSFFLSLYIAPSVIWLVFHVTVENFFLNLYGNRAFVKFALIISIIIIAYEFIFCFINFSFVMKGYYTWFLCHFLSAIGTVVYILQIKKNRAEQ